MSTEITILYIDDEDINLQLFEYNFEKRFRVITDSCGANGLKCLEKYPEIDVVISDMKMPGMNGLEFINKARETYSDKKYFILTGFEITPEIRQALNDNLIYKYFRKPFDIKEIEDSIRETLKT